MNKRLMMAVCMLPVAVMAQQTNRPVLVSSAGGWDNFRSTVTLSVEGDELVVKSSGEDPYVQTGSFSAGNGPFVLELEACSDTNGPITVFTAFDGKPFVIGSGIPVAVRPKQWNALKVDIPAGGKLTRLRLDPPGKEGTTRFRNVRLKDAAGNVVKEWFAPVIILG